MLPRGELLTKKIICTIELPYFKQLPTAYFQKASNNNLTFLFVYEKDPHHIPNGMKFSMKAAGWSCACNDRGNTLAALQPLSLSGEAGGSPASGKTYVTFKLINTSLFWSNNYQMSINHLCAHEHH